MKLFKKNPINFHRNIALAFCRSLSDEQWKTFKRAIESYRKSDSILSGEDLDSDINDIAEQIIETPIK